MARAKVTRTSYKQDSRIVQALAYGDLGNITESFFDETVRVTSEHRFVVLVLCGLVGDAAFANPTIIPFGMQRGCPVCGRMGVKHVLVNFGGKLTLNMGNGPNQKRDSGAAV